MHVGKDGQQTRGVSGAQGSEMARRKESSRHSLRFFATLPESPRFWWLYRPAARKQPPFFLGSNLVKGLNTAGEKGRQPQSHGIWGRVSRGSSMTPPEPMNRASTMSRPRSLRQMFSAASGGFCGFGAEEAVGTFAIPF